MDWRSYPGAPAPGTVLLAADALDEGAVQSVDLDGFPVLLVRGASGLRAFVNACPHLFLPLDRNGDRVLGADGARLVCSNHGAVFDADTGAGISGPGSDCALDFVPVVEVSGQIRVAGPG